MGYKVNMGDYETLSIEFGIEDDTRENEKARDCFARLYDFVAHRLDEEVEKARAIGRA